MKLAQVEQFYYFNIKMCTQFCNQFGFFFEKNESFIQIRNVTLNIKIE